MTYYPLQYRISEHLYDDISDGTDVYNLGETARLVTGVETGYESLNGYTITMDTESRTLFAGSMIDPPEYEYRVTLHVYRDETLLGSSSGWGEDGYGEAVDEAVNLALNAAGWED